MTEEIQELYTTDERTNDNETDLSQEESTLLSDLTNLTNNIKYHQNRSNLMWAYCYKTDTLYLWTDVGFWKVYEKNGLYKLFHKNQYNKNERFSKKIRGEYHRQTDVKGTKSLEKIIVYVVDHDKAKKVYNGDYRNLPRTTKKQKKYYNQAKKKQTKMSIRRMNYLFDQLENSNMEKFRITF